MVRVALAGLGFMGRTHLEAYSRLPEVEVVALCSPSIGGAANLPPRAARFEDFEAMLDAGGFDALDLCLPTEHHADSAVAGLEAGYHVLCEKPLALDLGDCARIVEADRQSSQTLAVAHCLRYWPAYAAAKRCIQSGTFGRVLHAELSRISPAPGWASKGWLLDPVKSGGAALDLHIHDVDLLLALFGPPTSVYARGLASDDRGVYHLTSLYSYPGFVAVATGGWTASSSYGMRMEARFLLEGATIEVRPSETPAVRVFPNGGSPFAPGDSEGEGYLPLLSSFVSAVETGATDELVGAEEATQAVALCLSEIRSVREAREIPFGALPVDQDGNS